MNQYRIDLQSHARQRGARLLSEQAENNFPCYAETGAEPQDAKQLIRRVNAGALAVQRPHEWLRLLGIDGDPREIARFKAPNTPLTNLHFTLAQKFGCEIETFNGVVPKTLTDLG